MRTSERRVEECFKFLMFSSPLRMIVGSPPFAFLIITKHLQSMSLTRSSFCDCRGESEKWAYQYYISVQRGGDGLTEKGGRSRQAVRLTKDTRSCSIFGGNLLKKTEKANFLQSLFFFSAFISCYLFCCETGGLLSWVDQTFFTPAFLQVSPSV